MATATKGKGREERRRSHAGRTRRPNLAKFYGRRLSQAPIGEYEFELTLMRGRGVRAVNLDSMVERVQWQDEDAMLTGSIDLRRPVPDSPASLPIKHGHQVRCRVRARGSWYELWRMRCGFPDVQVEAGTVSVELKDDLDLVKRTKRDWTFRKTKRRKHGYFAHEVTRLVARRQGIKLGQIAKGRTRIPKLVKRNATPLDMIVAAYAYEHEKTGRRFVIRMRNGRLEVVPYRRNATLYVLAQQIRTALASYKGGEHPATVIEGVGRLGKGKDAKKVRHTEYRREAVRRLGYVHREVNYGRVDSVGELRLKVRRELAKSLRVRKTATVSHTGLPFVMRGDGVQLALADEGFSGKQSFVYVTAARHSISDGDYTSEFDLTVEDPFYKDRLRREKEARAKKRKQRKRGVHS